MTTFKDFKDVLAEERLTSEVERYLFGEVLNRKPAEFRDLYRGRDLKFKQWPKDVQKVIKGLKTIGYKDLYGHDPIEEDEFWGPNKGRFQVKTPIWFKIRLPKQYGKKMILVDTEGADYARYAGWINM